MECEMSDQLIVALANMGLVASFKKGVAVFSRMLSPEVKDPHVLWISGAVHKVLIEFADEPAQEKSPDSTTKSVTVTMDLTLKSDTYSVKSAEGPNNEIENLVADHPRSCS